MKAVQDYYMSAFLLWEANKLWLNMKLKSGG